MIPDLKGFSTYYGLRVSGIGEDGDLIILGHHHHDPLRVIAALNAHARTFWGLVNLLDRPYAELTDLTGSIRETHAVLITSCAGLDQDCAGEGCWRCRELAGTDWWIEWSHAADEPGAFPVTVWSP